MERNKVEWKVDDEEWKVKLRMEKRKGEEEGGMEGEGSGLFMDDTEGGGWVRVHREVARLDQSQTTQVTATTWAEA